MFPSGYDIGRNRGIVSRSGRSFGIHSQHPLYQSAPAGDAEPMGNPSPVTLDTAYHQ